MFFATLLGGAAMGVFTPGAGVRRLVRRRGPANLFHLRDGTIDEASAAAIGAPDPARNRGGSW